MFEKLIGALGGNLFTGVAEVVGKFVTDPTKQAELQAELVKLEATVRTKALEIEASDRHSARQREMAVKDRTPSHLAYATLAMFLGYIAAVTFLPLYTPVHLDKEFINIALGWLGGTASTVVASYFGSSSSSARKDELLGKR